MNEGKLVITRTQIGRWASFIGGVALLLTLVLAVWQGEIAGFALVTLIIGVLGIGGWALIAPDDFRDWVLGRQTRYGSSSILGTLFFIGLVILLYSWIAGQTIALDMTFPQNFSLSLETLDVVNQLDRPVQLTGFYTSAQLPKRELDDVTYHLFETESEGNFRVVYVDPTLDPLLAQRFRLQQDGASYLTFIDETTGQPDLSRAEQVLSGGAQEREVANALLRLQAAGNFKVYFTTGHGELDPEAATPEGITGIFRGPAAQGIFTEMLDLSTIGETGIPRDATGLVIAGARRRFSELEVETIAAYLDRGGSLFVAADVLLDPQDTFLDADDPLAAFLTERYGITVRDDLIVDDARRFDSRFSILSTELIPHPATESLLADGLSIVFFQARSIDLTLPQDGPDAASRVGRAPIIYTSEDAFAETDLDAVWAGEAPAQDDDDPAGALMMAVVAEDQDSEARIVVIGDADFLRNNRVEEQGNSIFYTEALAWLIAFFEQVEIPPVTDPTRLPLSVTPETLSSTFILTVIVIPGAVLLIGFLVWTYRRRL